VGAHAVRLVHDHEIPVCAFQCGGEFLGSGQLVHLCDQQRVLGEYRAGEVGLDHSPGEQVELHAELGV